MAADRPGPIVSQIQRLLACSVRLAVCQVMNRCGLAVLAQLKGTREMSDKTIQMRQLPALLRRAGERAGDDAGHVSAFVTILTVALIALAGLVLDTGLALSAKVQALDAAQAAARTGAQQLDLVAYRTTNTAQLDPPRAQAAAHGWLTAAGLQGEAIATPTTVTVTVRRTTRTQLLHLIGVSTLNVSATATATAVHGVTGPNT
jgi:Flp pilus assembly protein TadG